MYRVIIYICIAIFGASCSVDSFGYKSVEYDTNLALIPMEQTTDAAEYTPLDGVVAYAYAADTTDYRVASYVDASKGIVSNKANGSIIEPIAVAAPYSGTESLMSAIQMQLSGHEFVMLVVADTKNEDYAYCNYEVGVNLPNTYITMTFRPWKEGSYTQSFWQYVVPEATIIEPEEVE